jgi:hypothetical protein
MPYRLDTQGCAIFLIRSIAMHTQSFAGRHPRHFAFYQEDADVEPIGAPTGRWLEAFFP